MPVGPFSTFKECMDSQMKKGKSKESAQKICGALEQSSNESLTAKNLKFEWLPSFEIKESGEDRHGTKWLKIGGTALTEGVSKNKNHYSFSNLMENDGKQFKYLFGHPENAENHVVGLGGLNVKEGKLKHDGQVRNTVEHPDVVEAIRDNFLAPSIHASIQKVTRKEGTYYVEGLSIDGIGLVAFQGVKNASIDYAIVESFDREMAEKLESSNGDVEKKKTGEKMTEEEDNKNKDTPASDAPANPADKPADEPAAADDTKDGSEPKDGEDKGKDDKPAEPDKPTEPDKPAESDKPADVKESPDDVKALKKELSDLKSIMTEMAEMKKKFEEKEKSVALVETQDKKQGIVEHDGAITYSEKMYQQYNKELREKVR